MDVVERPALDGARAERGDAGFGQFVRTGAALEMKAFTGVTGDAGGYAVPREIDGAIAAVLTPPDVGSQLLLAIPLCILYELALLGIWLTERRRGKEIVTAGGASTLDWPQAFAQKGLGAFLGNVALLFAALLIIRLMPDGISATYQRWQDRRSRVA